MSYKEPLDLSKLTKKEFPFLKKLDRNQEDMVNKLYKHKRVIVDAKAGSGKSSVLTQAMVALKNKGYINKIYYVVYPVQEGSLGYLPGGIADKIKEYAVPFYQSLVTAGVNPHSLDIATMCDTFIDSEYKVVPSTFLRGRTIEGAGIISDETQNATVLEIKKTLTRVTDDCYLAIAGHTGQIDIKPSQSGFSQLIHHFKRGKENGEFTGIEFAELHENYRGELSTYVDKIGMWDNK